MVLSKHHIEGESEYDLHIHKHKGKEMLTFGSPTQ